MYEILQKKPHMVLPEPDAGEAAQPATGIPAPLKKHLEATSRLSLDDVRIHYDSPKPAAYRPRICRRFSLSVPKTTPEAISAAPTASQPVTGSPKNSAPPITDVSGMTG